MLKETIICIIIIVTILGLDIFTQHYTEKTVSDITELLSELKKDILQDNKEEINAKLSKIEEKWQGKHDKLAYYIEHDELEKVDTAIVELRSYVETDDYSSAVAELEQGKFVLEHIKDKTAFNLVNIF